MRSSRSNTVTVCPARVSCCAAARPAGPEPTTATFLPVSFDGGIGVTRSSPPNAFSISSTSTCLMVTGSWLIPRTHDASQGGRAQSPGELREVVGGVQTLDAVVPLALVDQVVPLGNQIP